MSAVTADAEVAAQAIPPTLDDARRVADAFIDAGVAEVLVFGSVARGDATESSDIDLVAVFADLGDYSTRHAKARELCGIARAVAGRRCDVTVTDYCEWAWRTKRVSASFEHQIAPECVRLAKTPKKCVFDARKPIGMPADNLAEATSHLRKWIGDELVAIVRALVVTDDERLAIEREDTEEHDDFRGARNQTICVAVSMAVEKALKIGVQVQGEYPVSEKEFREMGHDISKPLEQLTGAFGERQRRAVTAFGLSAEILSQWRVSATYGASVPEEFQVEDWYVVAERLADDHVRTAVTVVTLLLAELRAAGSDHPDIDVIGKRLGRVWSRYRVTSPFDGEPRAVPLEERPWGRVVNT